MKAMARYGTTIQRGLHVLFTLHYYPSTANSAANSIVCLIGLPTGNLAAPNIKIYLFMLVMSFQEVSSMTIAPELADFGTCVPTLTPIPADLSPHLHEVSIRGSRRG
jgi:hypothetical protein